MSRRIVQIAAVPAPGPGMADQLFALDQNGIAWMMLEPSPRATWVRLRQLPSFENQSSPASSSSSSAPEAP